MATTRKTRDTLRDLEVRERNYSSALEELQVLQSKPIRLPSPEVLLDRARDLGRLGGAARRAPGWQDHNAPLGDGAYVAEFGFLALAAVVSSGQHTAPSAVSPMKVNIPKCAGRRRKP
jgi:hypothetical protein